eukprot:Gb_01392 [translate_table: standard]
MSTRRRRASLSSKASHGFLNPPLTSPVPRDNAMKGLSKSWSITFITCPKPKFLAGKKGSPLKKEGNSIRRDVSAWRPCPLSCTIESLSSGLISLAAEVAKPRNFAVSPVRKGLKHFLTLVLTDFAAFLLATATLAIWV